MPSSFVRLVIASRFWNFDFNSVALSLPPSFILERKPAGANTKKIAMREWRKAQIYHTWCAGDTKESRFCARKYLSDVLRLQKKNTKEIQIHSVCWWTDLVLYISNDYCCHYYFTKFFFAFLLFLSVYSVRFFALVFF